MLTIKSNPDYDKWASKARGDYNPCIICGRAAGKTAAFVRVHNGGSVVVTEQESATLNPMADMGMQPIGRNCLARHPEYLPYIQGE